ncbi:mercury resistance system periplasmic binding protein MerP [Massilia forsythiae]|uniref:Periplasmic mercury ion-binding protein n=1 Tax=Massilia forsythiae TaxID=2728020 RepID=A0A7Z2ZUD9_9BURK|nr:mercury resistance system periplasmic binding protein MerP [Massilia forsythiae]QJE02200.1 mercury resistance system periplasmic binding protein MerP [Massilia forsythiae]
MKTTKLLSLFAAVAAAGLLAAPQSALAKTQTVALNVPTMDCATCPITIKAALSKVPGVSKVNVSYEKREAVIVYDDAQASVADLKKASADVGYPAMIKTAR